MLEINSEIFKQVVAEAKAKCAGDPACIRAIERAVEQAETNPYLQYENGELLCAGATTNEIYRANGVCQCPAFNQGKLCWHRTLAKLMKRYCEFVALTLPGGGEQGSEPASTSVGSACEGGAVKIGVSQSSCLQRGWYYEPTSGRRVPAFTCEGWQV